MNFKNENGEASVSLYRDELANDKQIADAMEKLSYAFPMSDAKLAGGFFLLLAQRIKANKMTAEQLKDAVNNLIDNHKYKTITIADVINYDKREKLYSYSDALKHNASNGNWPFEYVGVINGRSFFKKI